MLIVSNYHYIREDFSAKYPSIFGLSPKQFRAQLEELAKHGSFISLNELLSFRNRPFDKNYILITFDDGLKEQYEVAKPILDEMGIPAIFFINTANFQEREISLVHKNHMLRSRLSAKEILQALGDFTAVTLEQKEKDIAVSHYNYDPEETAILKYLLNFRLTNQQQEAFISPLFRQVFNEKEVAQDLYFDNHMLKDLHRSGALGSHSHRHLPLGLLSREELLKELELTQEFFQNSFGTPSEIISYPYGSIEASTGISEEIEKAGFKAGFTMERAANKDLQEDSLLLSRFDCNDLPGGKNDLFLGKQLFKSTGVRKWHKYENSTTYQR